MSVIHTFPWRICGYGYTYKHCYTACWWTIEYMKPPLSPMVKSHEVVVFSEYFTERVSSLRFQLHNEVWSLSKADFIFNALLNLPELMKLLISFTDFAPQIRLPQCKGFWTFTNHSWNASNFMINYRSSSKSHVRVAMVLLCFLSFFSSHQDNPSVRQTIYS